MEKSEHIIETLHWLEVPNLLVENPHQKDIRNRGRKKRKITTKALGWKKIISLCVVECEKNFRMKKKSKLLLKKSVSIVAITSLLHWSGSGQPLITWYRRCVHISTSGHLLFYVRIYLPRSLLASVKSIHLFSFYSKTGERFTNSWFPRWRFSFFFSSFSLLKVFDFFL